MCKPQFAAVLISNILLVSKYDIAYQYSSQLRAQDQPSHRKTELSLFIYRKHIMLQSCKGTLVTHVISASCIVVRIYSMVYNVAMVTTTLITQ